MGEGLLSYESHGLEDTNASFKTEDVFIFSLAKKRKYALFSKFVKFISLLHKQKEILQKIIYINF